MGKYYNLKIFVQMTLKSVFHKFQILQICTSASLPLCESLIFQVSEVLLAEFQQIRVSDPMGTLQMKNLIYAHAGRH